MMTTTMTAKRERLARGCAAMAIRYAQEGHAPTRLFLNERCCPLLQLDGVRPSEPFQAQLADIAALAREDVEAIGVGGAWYAGARDQVHVLASELLSGGEVSRERIEQAARCCAAW